METTIGADAVKLAGLQVDLLQKIRNGQITLDHMEWFNSLTKVRRDQLVLSGEVNPDFKIWKKLKLGTGLKNPGDFRKAINGEEMNISDRVSDILGKPALKVANEETEIDLVLVTVVRLGFKDGATRENIYKRAKEFDLELCPAEVGPQLRLQYKDQPNGEWILVGMEPIIGSDGGLWVFDVEHVDDGLWLSSFCGDPDSFWDGSFRLVFARRK